MEAAICHPLINWYQLELHPYVDCRDPLSTSSVWWSTFGQFPPKWQSYLKSQLQIPVPWSFQKGDPSQDRCWCILTRVHQASPQHTPESPFPAARSQWQTMETQDGPFHVPCAAGSCWQASVFELNNVALILDKKNKNEKQHTIYIYIHYNPESRTFSQSSGPQKDVLFMFHRTQPTIRRFVFLRCSGSQHPKSSSSWSKKTWLNGHFRNRLN